MGFETEKTKTLTALKKWVCLLFVLLTLVLPVLCEIAFRIGWIPASPAVALSNAFGAGVSKPDTEFVEFFSTGQGDCTVIKSGNMAAIVDFGLPDESDALYWHLKELGIAKLDLAVVTHLHKDHIGGLAGLMERMQIDRLLISDTGAEDADTVWYEEVMALAAAQNITIYKPKVGGSFEIGSVMLRVLFDGQSGSEENNRSIVLRAEIDDKRILLMGDAESEVEKQLLESGIDLSCDILKLGHHGSSTSSSAAFLSRLSPRIAVASCGYDNLYRHPSNQTIARLKEMNIAYYRTDLDGTVRCAFSNHDITVYTERKENL